MPHKVRLPNTKIQNVSLFKPFVDSKINQAQILFLSLEGRKYRRKRRKCLSQAFSPFPTTFSKDFSFVVFEKKDFMVKD